jgi:hypothetical protein
MSCFKNSRCWALCSLHGHRARPNYRPTNCHDGRNDAGVTFGGRPEDQSWGARMVGLKDPDGNNLYLLQRR